MAGPTEAALWLEMSEGDLWISGLELRESPVESTSLIADRTGRAQTSSSLSASLILIVESRSVVVSTAVVAVR